MEAPKFSIFLNISDIASFIGQNKWDYITPFERLWKKYDPEYKKCLDEINNIISNKKSDLLLVEEEKNLLEKDLINKIITKRKYNKILKELDVKKLTTINNIENLTEKVNNISLTQSEQIEKELGKEIVNTINALSTDTNMKRKITNQHISKLEIEGKIEKEHKEKLLKQTESLINKCHGTLHEESAITIFEKKYSVKLDTSQKYYKYKIVTKENYIWYIGGKMDGIYFDEFDNSKNYIIEVKNRTKGFFSNLREYEKIQIQLYLLLTGFKQAKLVEKYKKNIRVTDILFEQQYINDILDYLLIFIDKVSSFWTNYNIKIDYINLNENDKKKFLNKLYIDDIDNLRNKKNEIKIIQADDCLLSDLDEF
jgi:hypothetical protein